MERLYALGHVVSRLSSSGSVAYVQDRLAFEVLVLLPPASLVCWHAALEHFYRRVSLQQYKNAPYLVGVVLYLPHIGGVDLLRAECSQALQCGR